MTPTLNCPPLLVILSAAKDESYDYVKDLTGIIFTRYIAAVQHIKGE